MIEFSHASSSRDFGGNKGLSSSSLLSSSHLEALDAVTPGGGRMFSRGFKKMYLESAVTSPTVAAAAAAAAADR